MIFYEINKSKLKCPTCGRPMIPAVSIRGTFCDNWVRCENFKCKTFMNCAIPMPHQYSMIKDPHSRVGYFGAYGSGKTFASYQADEKHILITEAGETLIGAATLVQIENTIKKDLEGDFPAEFVRHYNKQKNQIQFINGHLLHYRPLTRDEDIRSYNLTRAHLLEASNIKHDLYIQTQARVRNEAAMIPERDENGNIVYEYLEAQKRYVKKILYDWTQTVVESNPGPGWIKDDFLLRSGEITIHYDEGQEYFPDPGRVFPFVSSHISPTKANYELGPNFLNNLKAGKPEWWVRRYIDGSFEYAEGLVYPNFVNNVIDDFPIPKHWERIIGFDYGLNDKSHFVYGAIDWRGSYFGNGVPAIFWYGEVVENNLNIRDLATKHKIMMRETVPAGSLYTPPVMDQRSFSKRTVTGANKTIGALFLEQGCYFKPAQMNLDARIMRGNNLIDHKQEFFFREGVKNLNEEMRNYKYPEKKIMGEKSSYKPEDKNNHGVNAREFAIMELPPNLKTNVERAKPSFYNEDSKRVEYFNPYGEAPVVEDDYDDGDGFGSIFEY